MRWTTKAIVVAVLIVASGCASRPKSARAPEAKPWLDGRSLCALDLGGVESPPTSMVLRDALEAGARRSFVLPATRPVVRLESRSDATAALLRVDLTEARISPDRRPPSLEFARNPAIALRAQEFELRGDPIRMGPARVTVRLAASDARFERHRYKEDGRPALVLAGASQGLIHLSVSKADMEAMLLESANKVTPLIKVKSVSMRLETADGGRDVRWQLDMQTRVMLLPATLHIAGRARVAADMMTTLSGMECWGDEVLGPLMASLVRPSLYRYEGRTRPLLSFGPKSDVRLLDARVTGGERFAIDATFGTGK